MRKPSVASIHLIHHDFGSSLQRVPVLLHVHIDDCTFACNLTTSYGDSARLRRGCFKARYVIFLGAPEEGDAAWWITATEGVLKKAVTETRCSHGIRKRLLAIITIFCNRFVEVVLLHSNDVRQGANLRPPIATHQGSLKDGS